MQTNIDAGRQAPIDPDWLRHRCRISKWKIFETVLSQPLPDSPSAKAQCRRNRPSAEAGQARNNARMKNLFEHSISRTASLAILGTAVMLSSTSALGEAARINLKVSVTILPDCTVRAAVVDWISGSRVPITEQRISRDLGILVTTCEGAAPPPVSLKSIAADGQSRPLRAETHVAMDGMVQPLARALPVRVTRSVVVHLPRSDAAELAAPHAPDLLLAIVSF